MVAKKKTTAKKPVTKRRKPAAAKQSDFNPNEVILAVSVGAVLILVALALVTSA